MWGPWHLGLLLFCGHTSGDRIGCWRCLIVLNRPTRLDCFVRTDDVVRMCILARPTTVLLVVVSYARADNENYRPPSQSLLKPTPAGHRPLSDSVRRLVLGSRSPHNAWESTRLQQINCHPRSAPSLQLDTITIVLEICTTDLI